MNSFPRVDKLEKGTILTLSARLGLCDGGKSRAREGGAGRQQNVGSPLLNRVESSPLQRKQEHFSRAALKLRLHQILLPFNGVSDGINSNHLS